jgi:uncharacterized oxidoreductase
MNSIIRIRRSKRFIKAGNTVIVCGRRDSVLQDAREKLPSLITRVSDVGLESERTALFDWVTTNYPDVNVLVNNAGIGERFHVLKEKENWSYYSNEIAINFEGPVHLSMLFAPFFATKQDAAIVNVTSGLAFTPLAISPIYSATKAALHSFTVSLRHQLSDTSVEVIEVAPPAVQTAVTSGRGEPLDAFADGIFEGFKEGKQEIGYGTSVDRLRMSRDEIDVYVENMYQAMKSAIE